MLQPTHRASTLCVVAAALLLVPAALSAAPQPENPGANAACVTPVSDLVPAPEGEISLASNCSNNSDCASDEYCAKPGFNCNGNGKCELRPDACILVVDPVCGCDGQTYSNACFAAAAGVNVASDGPCDA